MGYEIPGYASLCEPLLTQKGASAVVVWAPRGLAFHPLSNILDGGFFKSVFVGKKVALGDVIVKAFGIYGATASPNFTLDIYTLQGCSALRIR